MDAIEVVVRTSKSSTLDSSFRDQAGFMFERDGVLYRQINRVGAEDYERLMASGPYEHLVERGC